jgi:hypothetical protein
MAHHVEQHGIGAGNILSLLRYGRSASIEGETHRRGCCGASETYSGDERPEEADQEAGRSKDAALRQTSPQHLGPCVVDPRVSCLGDYRQTVPSFVEDLLSVRAGVACECCSVQVASHPVLQGRRNPISP